jgi:energy-coupling factor transporter ATP-binding protein EcfA2
MSGMCGPGSRREHGEGLLVQVSTIPGYGHRYRRWVLDSLKYIVVQDLATGGDHIPKLGELYVDVALVSRASDEACGEPLSRAAEDICQRHSISELLDRRSRAVLVLIGPPGSGKSTLLVHAARRSAQTAGRRRVGRRRAPILLALREYAESIATDPAISLPDVVRDAVGGGPGKEPRGWWERQLRLGRCLVLLDGLDEVARADDRLAVADWIERQIAAHVGNHFVVTSRSHGLPGPRTAQADVFVVRPFTADQVRLFLDRWYLAAERHATGGSGMGPGRAVQVLARESAARLTSLIEQHPALHDLSVNPLLLTMIAAAHRYRGALPESRADLYGEICHVLLSRRGQAKDLPELLPWPAKQALLARLAYHMMRAHVTSVPADQVLEILGPQLQRFPSSVTGEAFLDDILRNGLFVEAPSGRYSFAHLTFQEYLAARHVSASPDLVKSLASKVHDPWWHETILLYAATADASPIVRACLDSGTIPALTLAFDCCEASIEIDPDLRYRLDAERQRAFEPGCSAEHRRLIVGVLTARFTRQTLTTAAGTRICTRPVPADLYWLFLADTQAPHPDSPCDPRADQPAIGAWGTEARAFVRWLNSITATATGIEVRLPRQDELQEEAIATALSGQLPASVTCAWTQPSPELWLRPGQPHPHELSGVALHQALAVDAANTPLVPQILTAAVLNVALTIIRDLDDIRALSGALAEDLTARANSGGQAVGLMHAHAHAIVLTYVHALHLTRAGAVTDICALDPDLIRALNLAGVRALADAIARDLPGSIDLARCRAVELADAIDLDMSILSAFDDFDIGHAINLARIHASDLDRADLLARSAASDHDPYLARFGLPGVRTTDPGHPLPGFLGLSLRWIADGPLVSTLLQVLTETSQSREPARPLPGDVYLAFARALSSRAGINETTQLKAALDYPFTDALRDLEVFASRKSDGCPDESWATGFRRLADACVPMCDTHQAPSPPEAAALRAVALGLADGSTMPGSDAAEVLLTVAATVTLIENRRKGESRSGESIILALS